jgi:hypothetical protein
MENVLVGRPELESLEGSGEFSRVEAFLSQETAGF